MHGIVLINKPKGITSFDCVRFAKKIFHTNKIGHTGTLDPFAEGLLILCIGKATKLVDYLTSKDKTYQGILVFNNHYDTYDVTGKILKSDAKVISKNEVLETFNKFVKTYDQIPPIYSAIKVDGKKLYEYARKEVEVEIEPRKVTIYSLDLIDELNENEFLFETKVSKGTYIRSLAVDIAKDLNTFGALKELKRTKIGNFDLSDAVNLNDLNISNLITLEEIFKDNEKVILNDYMVNLVKNGIYLDERQIVTSKEFLVYDSNNNLIAIYEPIDVNKYRPLIIL